jgi:hypothetical protein
MFIIYFYYPKQSKIRRCSSLQWLNVNNLPTKGDNWYQLRITINLFKEGVGLWWLSPMWVVDNVARELCLFVQEELLSFRGIKTCVYNLHD